MYDEWLKDEPKLPKEPEWMKEEWAVDHRIKRFFIRPYSRKELMIWWLNRLFGPSKRHKKLTRYIPKEIDLNDVTPRYTIGFVGDIMKMYGYGLEFDESVYDFFENVGKIVGNLEGILTVQPGFISAQRHNKEIMQQLSVIKDPEDWILCLSNNHSGDFGFADFIFHLNRLNWADFNVFGRKDIPNHLYKKRINIVSGTQWQNQDSTSFVTRLDEVDDYFIDDPQIFNILYPHWNYEYELYPRKEVVKECEYLLKGWDLIIGHHPHVVQPVAKYEVNGINKLVAYSLGNFCSGRDRKGHEYGIILKCEIGELDSDPTRLAVGKVRWEFVRSERDKKVKFKEHMEKKSDPPAKTVKIVPNVKYLPKDWDK